MDADRRLTKTDRSTAAVATDLPPLGAKTMEHPMMAVPFTAEIDGRHYHGDGLSLTRADIVGLLDPQLDGATRLVQLLFTFDGFTVALAVDCLISIGAPANRAALTFRDPAGQHLPQLRHLLNSYIAGDLVTLGQTLVVSPAAASTGARAKAMRPAGWRIVANRIFGTLILGLATLVLLFAVARIGYSRIFALEIPTAAHVTRLGQTLSAVTAGQVDYVNLDAAEGEVAFSIKSVNGQSISIAMPCDCDAQLVGPDLGGTVLAGEPVIALFQPDAPLALSANVARDYLYEFAAADHVRVVFADGTTMRAAVDAQSLTVAANLGGRDDAAVNLVPETPLPATRLGQLAELTIVRQAPEFLTPALDLVEQSGL